MRLVLTVIGLAAVLGVATLGSPPVGGAPGTAVEVSVDPVRQPVVCPGPLTVPAGSIISGDEELDSGSTDVVLDVIPDGESIGAGTAVDAEQAVSLERIGSGDIAGLAGAACTAPEQEQWLVGGSTTSGSSARLVLANPTAGAVRATIDLHGPLGASADPLSVLLAPYAQEDVLLESVALAVESFAVRVRAPGTGVVAALQDSRLDGFTAAGTDWVSPSSPATDLIVPVTGPATDDAVATLSLVAPDGADATLTLLGADGPLPWLGDDALTLEPGEVTDVQVPAGGLQAVRVEASSPVVGGAVVRIAREAPVAGATAYDHAWTGGQATTDERERAAVVPSGAVQLVVASAGGGTFTADAAGEPVAVDVPASGMASLALDLAPGTVISSSQPFAWALLVTDAASGFATTIEPVSTELEPTVLEAVVAP
ncbi:DUF5719 family protein [Demequina sp. NBRC 110053]|uniref:DUF5719 family protein n=1 Tax=Demequina sp. NBRC 110053 TaxID=1570342 RepID=UPI0009FE3965|nr:DUF5719 family protein [Demequina sp. NBRC 110053]